MGFSLTEMLIATGIMAVGLVLVATIFPVGVKLTGLSAERSIAAVAADEAFAKVRLYGLRDFQYWPVADANDMCTDFMFTSDWGDLDGDGEMDDLALDWSEFLYPSTVVPVTEDQKYHWSALCRRVGDKDVQVTVFVTRRTFAGTNYYGYPYNGTSFVPNQTESWPSPVRVSITFDDTTVGKEKILYLADDAYYLATDAQSFFNEGYTVVDDYTGKIYRILEKKKDNGDEVLDLVLYDEWQPDADDPTDGAIWVVPPGVGSSRYPCVGVFQRVLHFDEIN